MGSGVLHRKRRYHTTRPQNTRLVYPSPHTWNTRPTTLPPRLLSSNCARVRPLAGSVVAPLVADAGAVQVWGKVAVVATVERVVVAAMAELAEGWA